MGTKLRKSKMAIGVVFWFAGIILLMADVLGLLLEMSCYGDNFPEHVTEIMSGDYQDTGDFQDYILNRVDNFLSMSVAKTEDEAYMDKYSDRGYNYDYYAWGMEDWGTEIEAEVEENGVWETEIEAEERGADVIWEDEYDVYRGTGRVYNYYDYYDDRYGRRYDVIYQDWDMSKKEADTIHNRIQYNTNVLYRIENKGEVLYTNYENLGCDGVGSEISYAVNLDATNVFLLPEGYNYMLYYDGTTLKAWKNGKEVKLKEPWYYGDNDWYIPGYGGIPADDNYVDSRIYMAVAKTPKVILKRDFDGNGNTYYSNQLYNIFRQSLNMADYYRNWLYNFIIALVFLAVGLRLRAYRKEAYDAIARVTGKLWYEVKLLPVLAALFLCLMGLLSCMKMLRFMGWDSGIYEIRDAYYGRNLRLTALMVVFSVCVSILWLFINDIRYHKTPWENSLIRKAVRLFQTSMLALPLSKRMVRYNMWVFLMGLLSALLPVMAFIADSMGSEIMAVTFFILLMSILFLQFLYVKNMRGIAVDVDHLVSQIKAVHDGELQESVEVSEGSGLSEAMENLSDIRNGMNKAIKEQMKSERMKVELIANVSHDIKTPLTSIISYVELLKQEDGLPEHVEEYVSILESKSQRLKAMVQDVFEVSKAASGELPVHMENLDFGKLILQTVADMQEEIADSAVCIKCDVPDRAVMIYADGERLYRVFQNLIQNALKYSLEGSRVYLNLQTKGNKAVADVKNTSKEELPSDMDFTERFIRGDKSRTDGGSGLGLSIAQSFTEACGGEFGVETIADLFVVTVSFDEVGLS